VKTYVVLAGNIGAGKSTLVRMISDRLGWEPYYEPVTENPYLADFYAEMKRWAFHSQVFFLTHRAAAHRALMDVQRPVVQDRSFYEDAEVFARSLHRQGAMSDRDWGTYQDLYRTLTTLLAPPDLVVYIRASVPTLRRRIAERGRDFEARISDAYLEGLNALYEEWVGGFGIAPVLAVPGDTVDFVRDPAGFDVIVAAVTERLRGMQGVLFPDAT
jgi:deoxyadenosine/deoxycytidine kinase